MSVEKLLAALEKETDMREEAMMAKARAQAQEELALAEKKAAEMESAIAELKREHDRKKESARRAFAKIGAREAQLKAGWATVRLAFDAAEKLYADFMNGPEYPSFIVSVFLRASAQAGRAERVLADPITAKALGAVDGALVETDPSAPAGFVIYSGGGVKASFNVRSALTQLWREGAPAYYPLIGQKRPDAG